MKETLKETANVKDAATKEVTPGVQVSNVHGSGAEEQGSDHVQNEIDATNNRRKESERLRKDKELSDTDKKLKDPTAKTEIKDTAILKAITEDSESVKALLAVPNDFRSAEYSTVVAFYYKRINANVVKLHDLLVKEL